MKAHFELLANYNQWMNAKVYESAGRLSADDLAADRGAFFGSILGTLNHLVVADTIWLKRFAAHPSSRSSLQQVVELPNPKGLDQILFDDFAALSEHRAWLDARIIHWIDELNDGDFIQTLHYKNTKGVPFSKQFSNVLTHFFNHQTHHRGQITTLLSQAGEDVGVTDLLVLIPDDPLS